MFERFSRSWQLVKASGAVLMQDQKLLVFPLISAISALLVLACFALPMFGFAAMDGLSRGRGAWGFGSVAAGFLFYLTQYFVIFFFNAALVGAAMMRLDGGTPTIRDGLNIALSKWQSILGYAAIAATVGMLLRALQQRVGFLGKIIVGLIGAGWTVATYLVVPVLVANDVGPLQAVKESVTLLKKTWGENVIGQAGISTVFALIQFVVIVFGVLLVIAAVVTKSVAAIILAGLIAVTLLILTSLVHAALSGIYAAALYRYASGGRQTAGFDSHALENAFRPA
ncbi:MAG: DUF6159 family protein [Pseudomonadota bacterium]